MSKIQNFRDLATTEARRKALEIVEAGLESVDTRKVVADNVKLTGQILKVKNQKFDLGKFRKVYLIAIGKCAVDASLVLEKILGDKLTGGLAYDLKKSKALKKVKSFVGSHPFPTQGNVDVTEEIIKLLKDASRDDFVLFVISGGGSTLLCSPENMVCRDEEMILRALFTSGADIKETNIVRKHISRARGGQLAKYAYPAKSVSLIFSDVPGNDLQFVASGPTIKDKTTIKDTLRILKKYKILEESGLSDGGLIETPKDEKYFKRVTNIILVSDETGLSAMSKKAVSLGFKVKIGANKLGGEAWKMGEKIAADLTKAKPGTVILYSGETTVTGMNTKGQGGRNQELVLASLAKIPKGGVIVSFDTDGTDNSDHAGALGDEAVSKAASKLKLKTAHILLSHQSYLFFDKTKSYLLTGLTGSNVSDLAVALKV